MVDKKVAFLNYVLYFNLLMFFIKKNCVFNRFYHSKIYFGTGFLSAYIKINPKNNVQLKMTEQYKVKSVYTFL